MSMILCLSLNVTKPIPNWLQEVSMIMHLYLEN